MKVKKTDFIRAVAAKNATSVKETEQLVGNIFEELSSLLAEGNELTMPGFGTFKAKVRPERQAKNPATGETFTTPAVNVVQFKMATALKARMNPEAGE